jgi:16S rRNA processing protein RimM
VGQETPPFIAIARIARTRGNRGEVLAELHTDFPDRFDGLDEVWVEPADGGPKRLALEDSWDYRGRRVLKFAGVDSISAAEEYVNCWVLIPGDRVRDLPEGTYYDHDLVGCRVEDLEGNPLGSVREILHIAGNTQLVVGLGEREFLIPAVGPLCVRISVEEKRIWVDPPEGLMDLGK